MVTIADIKSRLEITDTSSDAILTALLSDVKHELIAWRYGLANKPPIARAIDSVGNTVNVSVCVFIAAVSPVSGTSYVFTYSTNSWQYDSQDIELADYGLTVTGTPIDGETITVKYTELPLTEFDSVVKQAVINGYSQSGADGQTGHSENGISRTWKYEDIIAYICNPSHVAPMVGVS